MGRRKRRIVFGVAAIVGEVEEEVCARERVGLLEGLEGLGRSGVLEIRDYCRDEGMVV